MLQIQVSVVLGFVVGKKALQSKKASKQPKP